MRGLELSTREGDGHVVVVLRGAWHPRRCGSSFTWRLAVPLFQRSGGTGRRAEAGISVVVAGAILALPGMARHAADGRRHYCMHFYY